MLNILNSKRLEFAYSAIHEDNLVGILFAWKSSFHPYCTYFKILSNPLFNGLTIEEKLLLKLDELKEVNIPLQTSIWETTSNLKETYKNNGFIEIRRTYMPKLKVSDVVNCMPNDIYKKNIKSLSEILSNKILLEKLILLVKKTYEQTHIVNPVAQMGTEEWKDMILAEDVILNGSYIYLDDNENKILAYSFLHQSESKDSFELGWCGAYQTEKIDLIPLLILHQVQYASKCDIRYIIGEFDTTDNYVMKVLNAFPFEPSPTWITYQKK